MHIILNKLLYFLTLILLNCKTNVDAICVLYHYHVRIHLQYTYDLIFFILFIMTVPMTIIDIIFYREGLFITVR